MYTYDWMYEMLSECRPNESDKCVREWCKYEWCKNVIIEFLESVCVCGECVCEFLYVCLYERERLNAENANLKFTKILRNRKRNEPKRERCTENECDRQALVQCTGKRLKWALFSFNWSNIPFHFSHSQAYLCSFPWKQTLSFYVFILYFLPYFIETIFVGKK